MSTQLRVDTERRDDGRVVLHAVGEIDAHGNRVTVVNGQPAKELNRRQLIHGKGLAGYFTSKGGREMAIAIYVNNVAVAEGDPAIVAGQALGEIASIAWETTTAFAPSRLAIAKLTAGAIRCCSPSRVKRHTRAWSSRAPSVTSAMSRM